MNLPAAILLGIVQGLTEFLPVSSSAHLILARMFFGWEMPPEFGLAFDVALHVGTLAAIVLFFRADVLAMIASVPSVLSAQPGDAGRLVRNIVAGTIPVVIVGLLFNDFIEDVLRTPLVATIALAVGATLMLVAERAGSRTRDERGITWADAILIGCAQASALIPGMSRSGTTIAIAMFLGFRRENAARFTFLLAIPAMLAAAGKETLELRHMPLGPDAVQLFAVGMVVSAIVGYLTIKYFLRFLAGNRLDVFAYYRYALAACAFGFLLARGTQPAAPLMFAWLRRRLIAGFFVTVPLVISVAAFVWIFRAIDGFVGPFYATWLGREVPGLGIITTALVVLIVGILATNVIGKRVLQRAESYLLRVPVFKTIYAPVKQLVVAFSPDNEYGFKRVVLIEDPSRGSVLGFLTKEFTLDRGQGSESLIAVYVPTNHLYLGDVIICPRDKVSFPDITVEQGIRIFLTGGMALSTRVRVRRGDDRVGDFRV